MARVLSEEEIFHNLPVSALTLMNERGGDWMGVIHSWIQRRAVNGEQVIWGSNDFLRLKDQTVLDMELLAADVAEAAIREARGDLLAFFRSNKPSGLMARRLYGSEPTIVTPVFKSPDGELDHNHCVAAYSWVDGGMAYGQGKFMPYGVWENQCKHCTEKNKAPTVATEQQQ